MKYLINTTEVYRFDKELEAQDYIKDLKKRGLDVVSSTIQKKERKQKGEIIDEWIRLTVKINYNDEKEPDSAMFDYEEDIDTPKDDWNKGDINSEF